MAAAEVMQMKHDDEIGFSCPSAPPPSPEIPMKRNFFNCVNLTMDSSRILNYHRRQDDIDMDPDELLFNSQDNVPVVSSYQLTNFNVGDLSSTTHPTTVTPGLSIPSSNYYDQSETILPARMGQIQISESPTKKLILCTDNQSLSVGLDGCGSLITSEVPMTSEVQLSSTPPHSPARKRKISAHRSQEGNFSFSPSSPSSTIDMDQNELETSEKKRCVLSDDHSSFNVAKQQLMRRRNAICNPQPSLHMFRRDLSPLPDTGGFHSSLKMEGSKSPARKTSDCPVYGQFLNVDSNSMDTSPVPTFSRSL